MFVKNEGKRRLTITSVWFLVAGSLYPIITVLIKENDIVGSLVYTAVFVLLAFSNPNKKYNSIIYTILAVLVLLVSYTVSKPAAFGAISPSRATAVLAVALAMAALAILAGAQFSHRPERWLKFRFVPAICFAALTLRSVMIDLFGSGGFIFPTLYLPFFGFLAITLQWVTATLAFHQLSMEFCQAAHNRMAEKVAEEGASFQIEPPKKRKFSLKKVVKSALLLVVAFAFISSAYYSAVAVFADDPVITVNGETYTVVKNSPNVTITAHEIAQKNQNQQAILDEINSEHQSNWPINLYSPEAALQYGITVLNDFFPTWTYDNRVRLVWNIDKAVWCIYGQVEDQDSNEVVGAVMFDSITGEVVRVDFLSFSFE